MIKWAAKIKNGAAWEPIPLAVTAGQTVRYTLEWLAGKETVAEFVIGGGLYYFCGTAQWVKKMNKRGKAVLASEAIEILERVKPELLDEVSPCADIEHHFPGSMLEQVTIPL